MRGGTNHIGEPSATLCRKDVLDASGGYSRDQQYMIDLDAWVRMLDVGGLVENPVSLSWDDFLALPQADDVSEVVVATCLAPFQMRPYEASVQQETLGVGVARGGVLPSLSFDYFYGINANQWEIYNPEGDRLLGSSASVQMTIPLWSWGAVQSKIRQSQLRLQQAKAE